ESFCFLPLSSTVKSSGLRSVAGLPALSVAITFTRTRWVVTRMVGVAACGSAACWPAATRQTAAEIATSAVRVRLRVMCASGRRKGREPRNGQSGVEYVAAMLYQFGSEMKNNHGACGGGGPR